MFFSLVPGMRAARRIGIAERREKRGDLHGALRAHAEALEILGRTGVNLERGWCRSAVVVALWGYAYAAHRLGMWRELLEMVTRWRPVYLRWVDSPVTPDEGQALTWFEELLESQARG